MILRLAGKHGKTPWSHQVFLGERSFLTKNAKSQSAENSSNLKQAKMQVLCQAKASSAGHHPETIAMTNNDLHPGSESKLEVVQIFE